MEILHRDSARSPSQDSATTGSTCSLLQMLPLVDLTLRVSISSSSSSRRRDPSQERPTWRPMCTDPDVPAVQDAVDTASLSSSIKKLTSSSSSNAALETLFAVSEHRSLLTFSSPPPTRPLSALQTWTPRSLSTFMSLQSSLSRRLELRMPSLLRLLTSLVSVTLILSSRARFSRVQKATSPYSSTRTRRNSMASATSGPHSAVFSPQPLWRDSAECSSSLTLREPSLTWSPSIKRTLTRPSRTETTTSSTSLNSPSSSPSPPAEVVAAADLAQVAVVAVVDAAVVAVAVAVVAAVEVVDAGKNLHTHGFLVV
mmetsp:Transcript_5966/g.12122  ORF Transcript_5966/g.12122 Transcript_5966/m.12122 type:complete len:313 (-) Transcript_5966:424-1362(-)